MLSAIPSVYCRPPLQPGGVQSGQRPGPSCFENSTWMPVGRSSSTRIAVVIGQLPSVAGESPMIACAGLIPSTAAVGAGAGAGAGVADDESRSVSDPCTGPRQVMPG